jgi:2-keto-3-deoxy-L-rhamnonate aldolase RhmA
MDFLGKPADRKLAHKYLQHGALFVAVGGNTSIFVKAATELAGEFSGAARAIVSDGAY